MATAGNATTSTDAKTRAGIVWLPQRLPSMNVEYMVNILSSLQVTEEPRGFPHLLLAVQPLGAPEQVIVPASQDPSDRADTPPGISTPHAPLGAAATDTGSEDCPEDTPPGRHIQITTTTNPPSRNPRPLVQSTTVKSPFSNVTFEQNSQF